MINKIKLIIGLGNPGKQYQNTYHNAGFLFVDFLIKNLPISNFKFLISKPLKTDVYMNESGSFVARMLKKFSIAPEKLLIVHDDSDLKLGNYKISFGRGSAGHKGIESIIRALSTKNFWRLRIGIRPNAELRRLNADQRGIPPKKAGLPTEVRRTKAGEFVLKKISAADQKILKSIFEQAFKESLEN